MKSKLLVSLGLIGCLIASFALPMCAPAPSGEEVAPPPEEAVQPTINTFTWADYTDWTEMDPSAAFSVETTWISQCYETLTHYNYPGETPEVLPCLATSWDVSEDGLKWTFHLREGVKFHCGYGFDADAVKYSIDRTMEKGEGAAWIWAPVESVKVLDTYTVEFDLKYAAPLDVIASSGYGAYITCPVCTEGKTSDWFWAGHDTGTGPYKITEYEQGEYTILERFDDYWGGWEDNQIDRFIYKVVPEGATRLKLLKAGEIDFTYNIARESIPELVEAPGIVVKSFPTYLVSYAHLNTQKAPLNDVRVRQAIAYATPYKDFVDFVLMGYGQQSQGVIPYGMLGYSENCKQYNLDLDKARALLAEAGYPDGGFTLHVNYISGVGWDKLVEIWGASLGEIGITLEATGMPWSQAWSIATGPLEERQDICIYSWWPTYIDPYDFLGSMLHSEEEPIGAYSFHLTYYKNPEFDELIDTANKSIAYDREGALQLYDQAQCILMEDSPIIPLYDYTRVLPYQDKWTGVSFNPAYDYILPLYDIRAVS